MVACKSGLLDVIVQRRGSQSPPVILGICGGFQMLGRDIEDPAGVESRTASAAGLGWLQVATRFDTAKTTRLTEGLGLGGAPVRGYEIRHGCTRGLAGWRPWMSTGDAGDEADVTSSLDSDGLVYGTSLHGLFEEDDFRRAFLRLVAAARGASWQPSGGSFVEAREHQIDRVADACAEHLDLGAIWRLVEHGAIAP